MGGVRGGAVTCNVTGYRSVHGVHLPSARYLVARAAGPGGSLRAPSPPASALDPASRVHQVEGPLGRRGFPASTRWRIPWIHTGRVSVPSRRRVHRGGAELCLVGIPRVDAPRDREGMIPPSLRVPRYRAGARSLNLGRPGGPLLPRGSPDRPIRKLSIAIECRTLCSTRVSSRRCHVAGGP